MTLHSSLLVNAFFYHCIKHLYSGAIYPTLSETLLPQHHLNLPSRPIFSSLDSECLACVCVGVRLRAIALCLCGGLEVIRKI